MSKISDEEIRVAAYYLWEKEGRPEGVEFDLWIKAKNQLASCKTKACAASDSPAKATAAPAKKAAAPAKTAKKK